MIRPPILSCALPLSLLCCLAVLGSAAADGAEVPLVEVMQGAMRGSLTRTVYGREVASFRRIPYAEPPIGDLRFRAPVPLNGWEGVLDATNEAPSCIQKDLIFDERAPIFGTEDCLFLNVYVPLDMLEKIKQSEKEGEVLKKIPVMVYIHGGGWLGGSGSSFNFGPELLLDEDIILVTMNYRLSAFGFLSTGDNASPGNYGLKDQTLALKWVNENIAAFGGDYDKVTIFGQSAGGASAHYHVLSPLSKGLFQNAISHSGHALAPWAMARDALKHAKTLAQYLNCPTNMSNKEIIDCLRTKDAIEITRMFERFIRWDMDPLIVFTPTVEGEGNDEKPFITEHPYEIMKTGKFNEVKWIAGMTQDDGSFRTAVILSNHKKTMEINDDFYESLGPLTLRIEETAKDPKDVAKKVHQFYFGDDVIGIQTHKKLTEMFNDRLFLNGLVLSMNLMTSIPKPSFAAYFFMFSHRGQFSLVDTIPVLNKTSNTNVDMGVTHCDDLIYLFPMKEIVKAPLQGDDVHMSKIMRKLWTAFAETGNPTPTPDSLIPITWEPVKPNEIKMLEIGNSPKFLKMVPLSEEYLKRYNFWESLKLNENENYITEKRKDEL